LEARRAAINPNDDATASGEKWCRNAIIPTKKHSVARLGYGIALQGLLNPVAR
jgi:hypothetical protein